jgi:hypothetical protein
MPLDWAPEMTESSRVVSLRGLPTELKDNIFAFIRTKADKRTVCLVNKEWNALMAPSLWEILESTFEPSPARSLDVLLQPKSGILPHVIQIYVRRGISGGRTGWHESLEATSTSLIDAIPKNSLLAFKSFATLPALVLVRLLESQQRLETLDTKWSSSDSNEPGVVASLAQAPWIASNLCRINDLSVFINHTSQSQNNDCRFLI